jgi:hypothetical protein
MKKPLLTSILFVLIFTFAVNEAFARPKVIVIKKRGSADGIHYNEVNEYHKGNYHSLKCKDPGFIICKWEFTPRIKGESGTEYDVTQMENLIVEYVKKQIPNEGEIRNVKIMYDGIYIKINHAVAFRGQNGEIVYEYDAKIYGQEE